MDAIDAYHLVVQQYLHALGKSVGERRREVSADTSFARGRFGGWFEIPPMLCWNAAVAARMASELSDDPRQRTLHRYLPLPPSRIRCMDYENDPHLVKLALHHQLLTGAVVYVHVVEVSPEDLQALDCYVVGGEQLLRTEGGMYKVLRPSFSCVTAREDRVAVGQAFDRIYEALRSNGICRLFYRRPYTFDCRTRYRLDDFGPLLIQLQRGTCPCPDGCNLEATGRWDVDHIVPSDKGGTSVLINLQAACPEYNRVLKRADLPVRPPNYLAAMANRWPTAFLPVDYLSLLFDQTLDDRGVGRFARAASKLAASMFGRIPSP